MFNTVTLLEDSPEPVPAGLVDVGVFCKHANHLYIRTNVRSRTYLTRLIDGHSVNTDGYLVIPVSYGSKIEIVVK